MFLWDVETIENSLIVYLFFEILICFIFIYKNWTRFVDVYEVWIVIQPIYTLMNASPALHPSCWVCKLVFSIHTYIYINIKEILLEKKNLNDGQNSMCSVLFKCLYLYVKTTWPFLLWLTY